MQLVTLKVLKPVRSKQVRRCPCTFPRLLAFHMRYQKIHSKGPCPGNSSAFRGGASGGDASEGDASEGDAFGGLEFRCRLYAYTDSSIKSSRAPKTKPDDSLSVRVFYLLIVSTVSCSKNYSCTCVRRNCDTHHSKLNQLRDDLVATRRKRIAFQGLPIGKIANDLKIRCCRTSVDDTFEILEQRGSSSVAKLC